MLYNYYWFFDVSMGSSCQPSTLNVVSNFTNWSARKQMYNISV